MQKQKINVTKYIKTMDFSTANYRGYPTSTLSK